MLPTSRLLFTSALLGLTALQPVLAAASSTPSGGVFTAGLGVIQATGNTLTIDQSTLRGVINWNNFSIGPNGVVIFNNGLGVTLNRVTGNLPSAILGQLLASGNVYVLNPNGVLIGNGATIHTGGDFLASTLNLSNNAFLSNGSLLFGGLSTAAVVNLGQISSSGGSVYLIGHSVTNAGSIASPNGVTGLAAGSQVLITDSSSGQHVFVQAPGGDVTNSGFLRAAQVELKSNGGNIYALAGNNGGQINATGTATRDGHVWLIATNGVANVSGVVSAANENGSGGAIETSGAQVDTSGAQIHTGPGGSWLLDPTDLTINSALASLIDSSLDGGTDVIEQTIASGVGGTGVITVASPISWTGSASLTLSAYSNIVLNSGIANTGAGNLTLRADNTGAGTGSISGAGILNFSGSTGHVALLYNPSSYASPTSYAANFGVVHSGWAAPANGSVSSQYTAYMLVNSAANLQAIDNNDQGVYALGEDIDITGVFTPLGATNAFTGILDGMGHTIANLFLFSSSISQMGMFRTIGSSGLVRNLYLTGAVVDSTTSSAATLGVLAAVNNGTVSNVSVAGLLTTGSNLTSLGGLVGQNTGTIQGAAASVLYDETANTAAFSKTGGLVGDNTGVITGSHANGTVAAYTSNPSEPAIGGLVGSNETTGIIANSYSTGEVTIEGASANCAICYLGGLVGFNQGSIAQSYATGAVSTSLGAVVAGGLAGIASAGSIDKSYATGAVLDTANPTNIGGLVGRVSNASITDSYATGAVTAGAGGGTSAGGLIGFSVDSTITDSFSTGLVSGGVMVGGLTGNDASSTYTNTAWNTTTSGQSTGIGFPSSTTGSPTGLTTTQLQNGTLPTGFNAANWLASSGSFPYLAWQGPLVTVSGTAYNSSSAPISGTTVDLESGGAIRAALTTNSSGFYSITLPANYWSGGVLATLFNVSSESTFALEPNAYTGLNLFSNTFTLLNGVSANLSGLSSALFNAAGANSVAAFLSNGVFEFSSGNVSIYSSLPSFTIDESINFAVQQEPDLSPVRPGAYRPRTQNTPVPGNILIDSTGSLIVDGTETLNTAGASNITLVAGGSFSNNAGAGLFNLGAGNWFVYSQNPANDNTLGLFPAFKQYNATYGVTTPAHSGNGLFYTLAPVITESLTGTVTKTYDGTAAASLTSANFATTGVLAGDTVTLTPSPTSGLYASPNAGTGLRVTAGDFSIVSAVSGEIPVYGYQLASSSATGNIGVITPATLLYTANPVSRPAGTANPIFTGSVTGFVDGQTLATATTGVAVFTSPATASSSAGSYAIDGSGLTANHGNYVFAQAPANSSALTVTTAGSSPTPPPPSTGVTLAFAINNLEIVAGQTPTFSATYLGPLHSGLNIASLLSDLTYTLIPAYNGPGTYLIAASGVAPSGYAFDIKPGRLTVLPSAPVVLPSQVANFSPVLPALLPAGPASLLQAPNSLGLFEILVSTPPSIAGLPAPNSGTPASSLSQSSFFPASEGKKDTYTAGAKP